jgi:hypothetical protein
MSNVITTFEHRREMQIRMKLTDTELLKRVLSHPPKDDPDAHVLEGNDPRRD